MAATNMLVVMSDEHDPRHMGAYGSAVVRTPNLDRLAGRGVCFDAAYTPSPICVPARAAFACGRHVHALRLWDNAMPYYGQPEGWGHALQRAGVAVEAIGKLHYRQAGDAAGFAVEHEPLYVENGIGMVWGSVRNPLPANFRPAPSLKQIGPGVSSYNLYDLRVAARACTWLRARAKQPQEPWLLFVGFVAPHFPLVVPRSWYDLYPPETLPAPRLHPRHGQARHPWIEAQDAYRPQDIVFRDDGMRRQAMAAYFGLCSYVDALIGMVLDTLEGQGLADSTHVVYTSDHGDNLGTRGLWGKSNLYEESARVPLILAGPDVPAGRRVASPASLLDLSPTILEAFAAAPAQPQDGSSLFGLAGREEPERAVLSQYHAVGAPSGAFMLRRGKWKLNHYVGFPPELFDLEADALETRNMAALPAMRTRLEELEAALGRMVSVEQAHAQARDDQAALVERFGGREAALKLGPKGATPIPGHGPE